MVKVGFLEDESVILAAVGVKISQTPFEQGSIQDLYKECRNNSEESKKLVNSIMKDHGHMILADFLPYAITIEDMSRFAAIYLWRNVNVHNLIMGAGIEASLRVIKPNRFNEVVAEFGKMAFEAYERAIKSGVPLQDARYMLPEGTLTRMIFSAPPRYLGKLSNALWWDSSLPEFVEIALETGKLISKKFGFINTQEKIPSQWKFWGKEKIKKRTSLDYQGTNHSLSLNMSVKGSLSMYAQLVRERLLLCDIEPLEQIARTGRFVVPQSFPEKVREEYRKIAKIAKAKQLELIAKKDPRFAYFLLLGQEAKARVYGKGSGVIETSRARSEGVAQWEIRNEVGIPITESLAKYPKLIREIGPRCWREGKCIEPATFKTKKSVCKAFEIAGGKWKGSLSELLATLTEPYQTFEL
jgi:thymidylate synthase ThyX